MENSESEMNREMTPPDVFSATRLKLNEPAASIDRRDFLRYGIAGTSAAILGTAAWQLLAGESHTAEMLKIPFARKDVFPAKRDPAFTLKNETLTDRLAAAAHNNFYEFLPGRGGAVYRHVKKFIVEPWKIEVGGLCAKPKTFDLDDIFKFAHEERVYRFRCVERWSMVIPWTGFPLHQLLKKVAPLSAAKYVRFISAQQPAAMPGLTQSYPWPYHEALRMDEAMHDLTLMATGVYGAPLLKQHGSPARIIVPWKYGYKSPKSIVKIELLDKQPTTFWSRPGYLHEYGFISNVNPNIPHPRWSQAKSYRLMKNTAAQRGPAFATALFNGYGEAVARLYPDEPTTPQRALSHAQRAR